MRGLGSVVLLHSSRTSTQSQTTHTIDNWRKSQISWWNWHYIISNVGSTSKLVLLPRADVRGNTWLLWKVIIYGKSCVHLAKTCECHMHWPLGQILSLPKQLRSPPGKTFKRYFPMDDKEEQELTFTTNSLLLVRKYWFCLLSLNTPVSRYFLFFSTYPDYHCICF